MSKRRRGFTAVKEQDWKEMKDMFERGKNTEYVRRHTHRGAGTMVYVRMSKSYADYKRISRHHSQMYKARRDQKEPSESKKDMNLLGGFDLPNYKETAIIVPKPTKRIYTPQIKESDNFSGVEEIEKSDYSMLTQIKLSKIIELLEQVVENTKPPKRKFGFFW